MKLNILGSEWDVEYRNADADPLLREDDGYTDPSVRLIVIANKRERIVPSRITNICKEKAFVMRLFMRFCLRAGWASILSILSLDMKKL